MNRIKQKIPFFIINAPRAMQSIDAGKDSVFCTQCAKQKVCPLKFVYLCVLEMVMMKYESN